MLSSYSWLPLIFPGLYQSNMPLPFSALLLLVFHMLAVRDIFFSPWTAVPMSQAQG